MLIPWFIAVVATCFLAFENVRTPPSGEEHVMYNVVVLKMIDAYHYKMRDERGTVFVGHFCEDYEPTFGYSGTILDILKYEDYGLCWSIRNTHPAYIIHRDEHDQIVREEIHE